MTPDQARIAAKMDRLDRGEFRRYDMPEHAHGVEGFFTYGCRCGVCCAAEAAYAIEQGDRR